MSVNYGYMRCYYKDAEYTIPLDETNYTTGWFYCNFAASGYRLPTEAEWEYACRAGTTGPFSCSEPDYSSDNCMACIAGEHPTLEQYTVYCANNIGLTEVVGSKLMNPAGLYDIHGNAAEWCWDWHGPYPSGSVTDPSGAPYGFRRVMRGGAWTSNASFCRSASRCDFLPYAHHIWISARYVRSAI